MQTKEIINIILLIALSLYVIADVILKIVKKFKGDEEIEWKAQLSFAADLIEKGIEIPQEILLKLLRRKSTNYEYAKFVNKVQKNKEK